jgi:hypothetical protein
VPLVDVLHLPVAALQEGRQTLEHGATLGTKLCANRRLPFPGITARSASCQKNSLSII